MDFMVDQLLGEARRRQVRVWADDAGRMQYDGSEDVLDDRFVALLSGHRSQIEKRLQGGAGPQGLGEFQRRPGPSSPLPATHSPERWFKPFTTGDGDVTVYLLPAAGAGPNTYRRWGSVAPPGLDVVAVLLPGREERFSDPTYHDVEPLTERIAAEIIEHAAGRPFALFGHSTGGLVAHRLAQRLGADSGLRAVAVAGAVPPDQLVVADHPPTDQDLLDYLDQWQGTPPEVLADPEFAATFLPSLRADLDLYASCQTELSAAGVIDVPLLVLTGSDDPSAPPATAGAQWASWTADGLHHYVVEGDHFFPVVADREVLHLLARHLLPA